jgi:pyruvate,water dikinase
MRFIGTSQEPAIAVVVQKRSILGCSGVMFTANPSSGDRSRFVIEAAPPFG